jgi:hypothetical protein
MLNIPRSQFSLAKDMIYPEQRKVDNKHFKQNFNSIKQKQEENRAKKEHQENYITRIFINLYSGAI